MSSAFGVKLQTLSRNSVRVKPAGRSVGLKEADFRTHRFARASNRSAKA
jgi:hypothetical protein